MQRRRLKILQWIASSKADLKKFPAEAQQEMGDDVLNSLSEMAEDR